MSHPEPDPVTIHGRLLQPGTELSIVGQRGRFAFIDATRTDGGALVLNVKGGPSGREMLRSFYADRVKRVHNIQKLRTA